MTYNLQCGKLLRKNVTTQVGGWDHTGGWVGGFIACRTRKTWCERNPYVAYAYVSGPYVRYLGGNAHKPTRAKTVGKRLIVVQNHVIVLTDVMSFRCFLFPRHRLFPLQFSRINFQISLPWQNNAAQMQTRRRMCKKRRR